MTKFIFLLFILSQYALSNDDFELCENLSGSITEKQMKDFRACRKESKKKNKQVGIEMKKNLQSCTPYEGKMTYGGLKPMLKINIKGFIHGSCESEYTTYQVSGPRRSLRTIQTCKIPKKEYKKFVMKNVNRVTKKEMELKYCKSRVEGDDDTVAEFHKVNKEVKKTVKRFAIKLAEYEVKKNIERCHNGKAKDCKEMEKEIRSILEACQESSTANCDSISILLQETKFQPVKLTPKMKNIIKILKALEGTEKDCNNGNIRSCKRIEKVKVNVQKLCEGDISSQCNKLLSIVNK